MKLAKLKGDFVWHSHENEDEYFQIFKGRLYMEFRDRTEVLEEGDMIIVPKGVEHNPYTKIMRKLGSCYLNQKKHFILVLLSLNVPITIKNGFEYS